MNLNQHCNDLARLGRRALPDRAPCRERPRWSPHLSGCRMSRSK